MFSPLLVRSSTERASADLDKRNHEKRKTTPRRKRWTYASIYYKSSPFKDNRDLIERGHAPGH